MNIKTRKWGLGLFRVSERPGAATSLFSAAEKWIRDQGMEFLRALESLYTLWAGLLVQGFDSPQRWDDYNPPITWNWSISALQEGEGPSGLSLSQIVQTPEWALSLAKRMAEKGRSQFGASPSTGFKMRSSF